MSILFIDNFIFTGISDIRKQIEVKGIARLPFLEKWCLKPNWIFLGNRHCDALFELPSNLLTRDAFV